MPPKERHVPMVEEFMRSWGYVPTPDDVRAHLIECGLTPQEAEEAVMEWESELEEQQGR